MSSKAVTRRSRLARRSACGPSLSNSRSSCRRCNASVSSWAACSASSVSACSKNGCGAAGALPWFGLQHRGAQQVQLVEPGQRRRRASQRRQPVPAVEGLLQRSRLVARAVQSRPRLGDDGDDLLALAAPQRLRGNEGCLERCRPGCFDRRVERLGPEQLRQRLGQAAPEQRGQARRRVLALDQVARERGREQIAGDTAAPEVLHHAEPHLAVVAERCQRHRHAGAEGRFGQRTLAEAVDGEDRGLVEGLQRHVQAQHHVRIGQAVPAAQVVQQLADERVGARGRRAAQVRQRLGDAAADAFAQLGRGGVGEGHDQDVLHLQAPLEQQPQVQAAQVPGLAGAGRGFDQARARERAAEDIECGCGHGFSRES